MKYLENRTLRSSEHVSPSHPDKVCDLIVERLLYYTCKGKPNSRFACDGVIKNNNLTLCGEVSQRLPKEQENQIILETLEELGYGTDFCKEFKLQAFNSRYGWYIHKFFTTQSPDIAQGVDSLGKDRASAGDIGIMYGAATNETSDFTFAPHWVSKYLLRKFYELWKCKRDDSENVIRPDMKCLTTVEYVGEMPVAIQQVTLCISHSSVIPTTFDEDITLKAKKYLCEISDITGWDISNTVITVNPTGAFSIYGSVGDSGCVGRKIVCDQYGGLASVGGGNLNGKDVTKVDRSAVYMARYIAKNIVAEGLAQKAIVQLAYQIGRPYAVSINVQTDGTPFWKNRTLRKYVAQFDTSVQGIIDKFDLRNLPKAVHDEAAAWGHIGRSYESILADSILFPWERFEY